jgi:hypothetical protein
LRAAGWSEQGQRFERRKEAEMRKVIVNEFMSLDGVVQAPGGVDEDTSGGFAHGGWHMRYMEDELAQRWVLASIVEAGGFLLGRRTYELFAAYWPNASEEEQVIAEPLNSTPSTWRRGRSRSHSNGRTRRWSKVTSPWLLRPSSKTAAAISM